MKMLLLFSSLMVLSNLALAQTADSPEYQIKSITVRELPLSKSEKSLVRTSQVIPGIGDILSIGKEMVALGESIYNLVQRGKPTNTNEFAPINVLPKDQVTNQYVDPQELEGVEKDVYKKYAVEIRNKQNKLVLTFNFIVTFEPGGSYNGKGKYILNAMVIPVSRISYGYDFTAKMKLQGIANKGTKTNPIASATLTLSYSLGSFVSTMNDVSLIHINGLGQVDVK